MSSRRPAFAAVLVASTLVFVSSSGRADDADFFENKIRPVLVEHCLKCHGGTPGKEPKGGLRIDGRASLIKGGDGGPALKPGDPEASKLIEAVRYGNADLQMPPKGKLPALAIADLVAWVKAGAVWPNDAGTAAVSTGIDLAKRKADHWAWKPVRPIAPPTVQDASWPAGPADRFVLAKLEAKGLKPAHPADPRTLIRRLYFDLIGLPPSPQEIETFLEVAKKSPQAALETSVDHLLASPHFGERWGRHWLDLVRYAETRGHEFDPIIPNVHQYRDYVIRALNADVPYDQFVREHVAGDVLPSPRHHPKEGFNESILGTGFWLLGEEVHSPVDIRQDQADRYDNRIDVLTKTFLGLTVACARCHDHKFDAIAQKDYYALFGFVESASYRLVRFDTLEHNRRVAADLANIDRAAATAVSKALAAAAHPAADRLAEYLLAARMAILTGPEYGTAAANDIVFEDFESGTYANWKVTGTAFGDEPQTLKSIAPYQGKINARGKFFVNSHNIRPGGDVTSGDAHTGTMLSKEFTIARGYITLLVGGGSLPGKTCVDLLIDDKVVRTATGRNDNQMFPVRWDVRDWKGKTARVRIVDAASGGWGNIGVDDIIFTDRGDATAPADVRPAAFSDDFRGRIADAARQRKLDAPLLAEWVSAILNAARDPADPFHTWATIATDPKAGDAKWFAKLMKPLRLPTETKELPDGATVVIDYAQSSLGDWLPDEASFGPAPVRPGSLRFTDGKARFTERAAAEYDRVWDVLKSAPGSENDVQSAIGRRDRAGRTIRTPNFKLTKGKVYYMVKGAGTAFAAVSGHTLIAGPLHGQLVTDFPASPGFRWVAHDLTPYLGLNLHVELTPATGSDFAVAMVVQSDTPPSVSSSAQVFAGSAESLTVLAAAYEQTLAKVVQHLEAGGPETPVDARLANFLLNRPALLAAADAGAAKKVIASVAGFAADRTAVSRRIKPESRLALALLDANGVDENLFIRGSPKGLGERVPRRFLEALSGPAPIPTTEGSGRLELARQMTDPATNPFVARVQVNRIWHHLFGRGIVASVDNFGVLGDAPTHPELLDALAARFAAEGWSVKKLIRELVLSKTYGMAARAEPAAELADPGDLLLHRMRLRRLEGEAIRDAMLVVSGRLDPTPFGPSVPIHLTPFLDGRGRPGSGPLDGNGRRSLYLATRRNFLSPLLQAFDTPIPFSTVGRRQVSNVPAQALILLNDPFVHQQAALWAKSVLSTPGSAAERIARMYLSAFGRAPTDEETAACVEFLDEQAKRYALKPDDIKIWADLAHILFNAKEFIYLN